MVVQPLGQTLSSKMILCLFKLLVLASLAMSFVSAQSAPSLTTFENEGKSEIRFETISVIDTLPDYFSKVKDESRLSTSADHGIGVFGELDISSIILSNPTKSTSATSINMSSDQQFTWCFSVFLWSTQAVYDMQIKEAGGDLPNFYLEIKITSGKKEDTPYMEIKFESSFKSQGPLIHNITFPDWKFVCLNVDFIGKTLKWAIDGHVVRQETMKIDSETKLWPSGLEPILMINVAFGRLTNIKMFGKETPLNQVKCREAGKFLAWDINNLSLTDKKVGKLLLDDVCNKTKLYMPITEMSTTTYRYSEELCLNSGSGSIPVIESDKELKRATLALKLSISGADDYQFSDYFWMNVSKDMVDVLGPNYNEFGCNTYNGHVLEETKCYLDASVLCQYKSYPSLSVRGLCASTKLDLKFYPFYYQGMYWIGESGDVIYLKKDPPNGTYWNIRNIRKHVFAKTEFPVNHVTGNVNWIVSKDEKCPSNYATKGRTLSLNACAVKDFNCADGSCINITLRCDARSDCNDGSDEFGCTLIDYSTKNYNTEIISSNSKDRNSKLALYIDMDLKKFLDIDENNGFFRVNFFVQMTWFDIRLQFFNLKHNPAANTLTQNESERIWRPKVQFRNSELWRHEVNTGPKINVNLNKLEEPHIHTNYLNNALVYNGANNNITLSMDISSNFICDFVMDNYPFDIQRCHVEITLDKKQLMSIRLNPNLAIYTGDKKIFQYILLAYKMCHIDTEEEYVKFIIVLERNYLSSLLTDFTPTILSNLIAYSTNFFPRENFDAAIGVNLTILLVITTMFIAISESLPKTGNIKLIEIWMLFSLLIPFIEVILQTYINHLLIQAEQEEEKEKKKKDYSMKVKVCPSNEEGMVKGNFKNIELSDKQKKMELVKRASMFRTFLVKIQPAIVIAFSIGYWSLGVFLKMKESDFSFGENCIGPKD